MRMMKYLFIAGLIVLLAYQDFVWSEKHQEKMTGSNLELHVEHFDFPLWRPWNFFADNPTSLLYNDTTIIMIDSTLFINFVKFDNSVISTTSESFYMAINCSENKIFGRIDENDFFNNFSNKELWEDYNDEYDYNGLRLLTFCERYIEYTTTDVFGNTIILNPLFATGQYITPQTSEVSNVIYKKHEEPIYLSDRDLDNDEFILKEKAKYLYTVVGQSVMPIDIFGTNALNKGNNKSEFIEIARKMHLEDGKEFYYVYNNQ